MFINTAFSRDTSATSGNKQTRVVIPLLRGNTMGVFQFWGITMEPQGTPHVISASSDVNWPVKTT